MLLVDEAGEMLTPTISEILVGARKYGLGLTLAHQFLDQLKGDKDIYGAVTGSCRTKICFQVSGDDARTHRVHSHSGATEFVGGLAHQRINGGLGDAIRTHEWVSDRSCNRRDRYKGTTTVAGGCCTGMLEQQEGSGEVGPDDLVPLLKRGPDDRAQTTASSRGNGVGQGCNRFGCGHSTCNGCFIGGVSNERDHLRAISDIASEARSPGGEALLAATTDHYRSTVAD
jgi:hypothetical protein